MNYAAERLLASPDITIADLAGETGCDYTGHTVNGFKALLHGWVLLSKGVTVVADGFPI